jgi:hypothetical protein
VTLRLTRVIEGLTDQQILRMVNTNLLGLMYMTDSETMINSNYRASQQAR